MDSKPWYMSKILWAQIISVGASVAVSLGVGLTPGMTAALTGLIIPVLTFIDRFFFTKTSIN